jgi:hypothetical protein
MAPVRSLTERKVPRRMAWRVMMPKKISTMFSQEQLVGVKCRVIRLFSGRASHVRTSGVLVGAVVVQHDVQLNGRVGGGDRQEPDQRGENGAVGPVEPGVADWSGAARRPRAAARAARRP